MGWFNAAKVQDDWFAGVPTNYSWDNDPKIDYLPLSWIVSVDRIKKFYDDTKATLKILLILSDRRFWDIGPQLKMPSQRIFSVIKDIVK